MPTITILYAGLLGLVAVGLASSCGIVRGKTGVGTGDGDNLDVVTSIWAIVIAV